MKRFLWLALLALGLGTKRHWHILFAIVAGASLGLALSDPKFHVFYSVFDMGYACKFCMHACTHDLNVCMHVCLLIP